MKFSERLQKFFFPPAGSPRWMFVVPYVVLGVLTIALLFGGVHAWEYTNSPAFCGTTCHTMPPQNAAYVESPHSNVTCEECHIGRVSFTNQLMRKTQAFHEIYYMTFSLYEYPIRAKALRPAVDTCEKCHRPETFSDDSLRNISHFDNDVNNTATTTYLIMKTGGGAKREGGGRGIHWHIVNPVYYYSEDPLGQKIPYVRVMNDDGTFTEYTDIESGFDPATVDESQLKPMDCITCHNRITHNFMPPVESVDFAMSRGLIDSSIPLIHQKAVAVLSAEYASRDEAVAAIAQIENDYKNNLFDYYSTNGAKIQGALTEIQAIYDRTVFQDQEIDWTTYPNNIGHINSPGCFRCHDGKHLDAEQQAVRLECNVCHSVPVVSGTEDFVTNIEISHGLEPETHFNANWISMHNQAVDVTCSNCHTTEDMGGTSNTSFCSNSACHGTVFTFAGFDAPALREIIKAQLPPLVLETPLTPPTGTPTYDNYIGALFTARCSACHGEDPSAGLVLTTYQDALKGSENGSVINPGDSANSLLVQVQSERHFKNFSDEELNYIIQWIDAGAPEK
ncbi:MAG: NapC/NirT family cytochrome c [Chloroflexi bacterium]|nr:NapC/NirT family cytochrome c [Chloroflexota bacterium]